MIAQQLIFGYRDGHRPLGGSVELDQVAEAALLGATDASIGPSTTRLITALPLSSVGFYALCGTWPAPEAGRPGAVWSHALLVPLDGLGELGELETLASELRRPSSNALADFMRPVGLKAVASLRAGAPDPVVLAQLLSVATEPDGIPVITVRDLAAGEAALFALWNSGWPELRATLSFRTRERVKATPRLGYLCVARRVTGVWRPQTAALAHAASLAKSRWVRELAEAPPEGLREKYTLRAFLQAFGPEGPPRLTRLVSLSEMHEVVRRGEVRKVIRMISAEYPRVIDGSALKRELLGNGHAKWWDATELDLVTAMLAVGSTGFDLKALEFAPRVRRLVAEGHAVELVEALGRRGSARLRSILLNAVVAEATPSLLYDVIDADPVLGEDVIRARPELLEHVETWSVATDDQAAAFAAAVDLSDRAIGAAVMADRFSVVKPLVSPAAAALRLARARELRALRKLLDVAGDAGDLASDQREELRIQLAAESIATGPLPKLLKALESRRDNVDEAWLRAAVYALGTASKKQQRAVLEVVFGPLHHAITDDRLPHDLWGDLDEIVPPAADPALRMRRLLVSTARDEAWPPTALERALRGGGPHVKQLKAESDGDDDPFVSTLKAALKAWRRLVG